MIVLIFLINYIVWDAVISFFKKVRLFASNIFNAHIKRTDCVTNLKSKSRILKQQIIITFSYMSMEGSVPYQIDNHLCCSIK